MVYDHAHLELLSARLERSDGEQALPAEQREKKGRLRFLLIGLALVAVFTAVVVGAVVGTNSRSRSITSQSAESGNSGLGQPTASPSVQGASLAPSDPPIIQISESPTVRTAITAAPVNSPIGLTQVPIAGPDPASFTTVLASGDRLKQAEPKSSPSGKYTFGLSDGGDLLLLDTIDGIIVWQLGGDSAVVLTMQEDGNLVLRREDDTVSWDSKTAGAVGASLRLNNSGVLSVAVDGDEPVWLGGLALTSPTSTPAPNSASDTGTPTGLATSSPAPAPTPSPVIPTTPEPTPSAPIAPETSSPVVPTTLEPTLVSPTAVQTQSPILPATLAPSSSVAATEAPSRRPSPKPTSPPSSSEPSLDPTPNPSMAPSNFPTPSPTNSPTEPPTLSPTPIPTSEPSAGSAPPTISPTFDPEAYVTVLKSGARLYRDQEVASQNNLYFFGLNGNGDMILYDQTGEILWLVQGVGAYIIEMGTDGHMMLKRQDGSVTWFSFTGLNGGATLRLNNSGLLFIAKGDGLPLWTGGIEIE